MLFQKLRPFALASLLLLVCGALALCEQNNPPNFPPEAGAAAGGAIALYCACVGIAVLIGVAVEVAILVFVYRDAKARRRRPHAVDDSLLLHQLDRIGHLADRAPAPRRPARLE